VITKNRLDKAFGPAGTSAGTILFISGIFLTSFHLSGLLLILIGAFVGFSYTSTTINSERMQIRFSNVIFGIIPVGKWIHIELSMKLGIKESNQIYTALSRGDRSMDIAEKDFRIVLLDPVNNEIMPVMKTDSFDSAQSQIIIYTNQLGLKQY